MLIYITVDTDGTLQGWGSNRGSENEIEVEVPDDHIIFHTNPKVLKYMNGTILKDEEIQLMRAKDRKDRELNAACNQAILDKFPSVIDGVTYYFSSDMEAQKNFDKAGRAFDKGWITLVPWTAYDGDGSVVRLNLDVVNFDSVYRDQANHVQSKVSHYRDVLMPQVDAVTITTTLEDALTELGSIVW